MVLHKSNKLRQYGLNRDLAIKAKASSALNLLQVWLKFLIIGAGSVRKPAQNKLNAPMFDVRRCDLVVAYTHPAAVAGR